MGIKASLNKCALNVFLKLFNVLPLGILLGSELHSFEAATQKVLSPNVLLVLSRGNSRRSSLFELETGSHVTVAPLP